MTTTVTTADLTQWWPAPRPARTVRAARTIRTRDVVVLGTAGPAYAITDALRRAGMSVGAVLTPMWAEADRAAELAAVEAARPENAAAWRRTTLVVSCFCDSSAVAHAVQDAVTPALYGPVGLGPVWLRLSPVPHGTAAPLDHVVDAPLRADGTRLSLPAGSARVLRAQIGRVRRTPLHTRVLHALLTLPAAPPEALPSCPFS